MEEKSRKIYVSEIDISITKRKNIYSPRLIALERLIEFFSEFGVIEKLKFIDSSKNGKNYAFLLMEDKSVIDIIMGDKDPVAVHKIDSFSVCCQRTITRAELMDKQISAAQERKLKKKKDSNILSRKKHCSNKS